MIRRIAFALFSSLIAAAAAADIHGAWTANADGAEKVHLFMTTGQWRNFGQTWSASSLGLDPTVLTSETSVPVNLKLARDAGTIVLEGTFKHGDGAGQFTFTPNRDFLNSVRASGLSMDLREDRSDDDMLFKLAVMDVSLAYIDSLRKAGVGIQSLRDVMRLRAVNVTPAFIDELAAAGYTHLTVRDLTRLAAVGVDGKFIRDMAKYGERK